MPERLSDTVPIPEIERRLRLGTRTVYALLKAGTIPAFRAGRRGKGGQGAWVILRSQFEAFVRMWAARGSKEAN